ncbi:Uncharacterized protein ACMD2_25056 [Ananas comosus]|uniref:O-fucosyltransferase family protein n=1 Tax=Ananas comosus TaxID=4615 RepID=A0A199VLX6_ANACO|nr:Uncharacterized protein ACMD2_25056 [Ananas comosus]
MWGLDGYTFPNADCELDLSSPSPIKILPKKVASKAGIFDFALKEKKNPLRSKNPLRCGLVLIPSSKKSLRLCFKPGLLLLLLLVLLLSLSPSPRRNLVSAPEAPTWEGGATISSLAPPPLPRAPNPRSPPPMISKFGDIDDEDHFIETLTNDVRVVDAVPEFIMERFGDNMSNYYKDAVLPKLVEEKLIRISPFANRLSFDAPPAVQRLRCLANFEALRFSNPIATFG